VRRANCGRLQEANVRVDSQEQAGISGVVDKHCRATYTQIHTARRNYLQGAGGWSHHRWFDGLYCKYSTSSTVFVARWQRWFAVPGASWLAASCSSYLHPCLDMPKLGTAGIRRDGEPTLGSWQVCPPLRHGVVAPEHLHQPARHGSPDLSASMCLVKLPVRLVAIPRTSAICNAACPHRPKLQQRALSQLCSKQQLLPLCYTHRPQVRAPVPVEP
jgi:hypothetical protein